MFFGCLARTVGLSSNYAEDVTRKMVEPIHIFWPLRVRAQHCVILVRWPTSAAPCLHSAGLTAAWPSKARKPSQKTNETKANYLHLAESWQRLDDKRRWEKAEVKAKAIGLADCRWNNTKKQAHRAARKRLVAKLKPSLFH